MISYFYLLRHGLTKDDMPNNDRVTGWLEVGLNTPGRKNAHDAARRLKSEPITSITSSDLRRTMETAKIVGDHLDLPIIESPKLRSWKMGAMEGLLHTVANPFMAFFQKNPDLQPPKAEKFRVFYSRWKSAWDTTVSYVKKFSDAHPLLCTHSQDLDLVDWFIKGIKPGNAIEFGLGIPPGGLIKVIVDGNEITTRKLRL